MHKKNLTHEQIKVLKYKDTEYPFTGKYLYHDDEGVYRCAGCDSPIFSSESKYDSGCGWPAFDDVVDKNAVELILDESHGMIRTEVICKKCGGHLGHVFDDRSQKTGKWYCINSAALDFKKK
ncbi:MAG: peptide-methionine (R)-S-oxide reductase MsrB [Candidatus Roizmanbacteria bacterium]